MKEEAITEPLPEGHERVQWLPGFRRGRCGQLADGKIAHGYCGRLFNFRGCIMVGRGRLIANVCQVCAMKEQLSRFRDMELARELAKRLGCSPEEASRQAILAFGYGKKPKQNELPLREVVKD